MQQPATSAQRSAQYVTPGTASASTSASGSTAGGGAAGGGPAAAPGAAGSGGHGGGAAVTSSSSPFSARGGGGRPGSVGAEEEAEGLEEVDPEKQAMFQAQDANPSPVLWVKVWCGVLGVNAVCWRLLAPTEAVCTCGRLLVLSALGPVRHRAAVSDAGNYSKS